MHGTNLPRPIRDVSLRRRLTWAAEIGLSRMGAATVAGFTTVYRCRPKYFREIYKNGELVSVECSGDVA
jgi:hypothetical protein